MSTEEQKHAGETGEMAEEKGETIEGGKAAEKPESGETETAETGEPGEAEASGEGETSGEAADVAGLQAEVDSLREELLRTHADMQNLRRRVDRDVENAHKYALEKFVGELVSVVDNLERAVSTIDKENEHTAALGEGVELTLKGLMDVLAKFRVEQVDPTGETFDPDKHQAMTMVPSTDVKPNTVIETFQKGYLLNGRLIRPAMVVVSKG